jgi:hypothetical protein
VQTALRLSRTYCSSWAALFTVYCSVQCSAMALVAKQR